MTDYSQLVKRLRYSVYYGFPGHDDRAKAADAIEALQAERDEAIQNAMGLASDLAGTQARVAELEAVVDQCLDDMGEDGLCVCPAAKEWLRRALLERNPS